eukprot:gnl/TRDRNA2_/TRDRNA2_42448_c0_seq1.p1 gnl/TRDRNA2_/TRDRNA2_42448_c0~~gnl/TRDRNA2_/TRDRNA2_42448_c0_seq1.p1  ORF type:complete len:196 (-),score=27.04 gnl/TRDRNA2_/TRDRNA2_42448_c0_seq1:43-630(-)
MTTAEKKELFKSNASKSRESSYHNQHVVYQNIEFPSAKKGDADYSFRSHATTFSRGGLWSKGSCYMRDPATGTWFKDNSNSARREFFDSGSGLAMRYTDRKSPSHCPQHMTIITAPCAGGFFIDRAAGSAASETNQAQQPAPLKHVPHMLNSFSEPFFRPSTMGGPKEQGAPFSLARKRPAIRPSTIGGQPGYGL